MNYALKCTSWLYYVHIVIHKVQIFTNATFLVLVEIFMIQKFIVLSSQFWYGSFGSTCHATAWLHVQLRPSQFLGIMCTYITLHLLP